MIPEVIAFRDNRENVDREYIITIHESGNVRTLTCVVQPTESLIIELELKALPEPVSSSFYY